MPTIYTKSKKIAAPANERGSEQDFQFILREFRKYSVQYHNGSLNFMKYNTMLDDLFASKSWSREEFYKEISRLAGN